MRKVIRHLQKFQIKCALPAHRPAVSHPICFPNQDDPPHGSTSHGKKQWPVPGDNQQNGHPKCSPGENMIRKAKSSFRI